MVKEIEKIPVLFNWASCSPDPVQYKPLNPTLTPLGYTVVVLVPDTEKYIYESTTEEETEKKTVITLTPYGMAYCLRELAKAIGETYYEEKEK